MSVVFFTPERDFDLSALVAEGFLLDLCDLVPRQIQYLQLVQTLQDEDLSKISISGLFQPNKTHPKRPSVQLQWGKIPTQTLALHSAMCGLSKGDRQQHPKSSLCDSAPFIENITRSVSCQNQEAPRLGNQFPKLR